MKQQTCKDGSHILRSKKCFKIIYFLTCRSWFFGVIWVIFILPSWISQSWFQPPFGSVILAISPAKNLPVADWIGGRGGAGTGSGGRGVAIGGRLRNNNGGRRGCNGRGLGCCCATACWWPVAFRWSPKNGKTKSFRIINVISDSSFMFLNPNNVFQFEF